MQKSIKTALFEKRYLIQKFWMVVSLEIYTQAKTL